LHNKSIDNANDIATRSTEMNNEQILAEIRETNLSYLMLAQNLIRSDREQALFRLGISEEAADRLVSLSPAQVLKIASSNTLVCRMRVDDDLVWTLLTNHGKGAGSDSTSRLHAAILMAGKHQEAA
jgi:flagellar transcriptional activator FlhD